MLRWSFLRLYLYFGTSKASKLRTCSPTTSTPPPRPQRAPARASQPRPPTYSWQRRGLWLEKQRGLVSRAEKFFIIYYFEERPHAPLSLANPPVAGSAESFSYKSRGVYLAEQRGLVYTHLSSSSGAATTTGGRTLSARASVRAISVLPHL